MALAGGGALDPELLDVIRGALPREISLGRVNVRGRFGPRGAVAAGAVELWRGGRAADSRGL